MNIAAYCRVSTDKEDQLNSLEAQKKFFMEYVERTGDRLVALYADEGISGTKIKNRREFLRMMEDAARRCFDRVVVKDISRFARNTVDLLQNIRRLRELGIETQFLTANMTSMGDSEFILTIFGAIAQEESANTSKRVKFGKRLNAEKGRVPNFVFGYDKTVGDYFNLKINRDEAEVVREIFRLYTDGGLGASRIAETLNSRGIVTKRGLKWSQNAVCNILKNELYIGRIINGKQEVADFLTGRREARDASEWIVTERPELRIVDDRSFYEARKIMCSRNTAFDVEGERHGGIYLFSTLIKCAECGRSFRRITRSYKNTYVRWVCSTRNGCGAASCTNDFVIDEDELVCALNSYFAGILSERKTALDEAVMLVKSELEPHEDGIERRRALEGELAKLKRSRGRFLDMFAEGVITREEMEDRLCSIRPRIEKLEGELRSISEMIADGRDMETYLKSVITSVEDIADVRMLTNMELKSLVSKIEVDREGNVDVYLRSAGGESVPVCDNRT